jgi:hypothetical protein
MTKEQKEPAFPCTPLQDNFGRLVVPVAGMSKYEVVLKDFMIAATNFECEPDEILKIADALTILYFKHLNEKNESDTTTHPAITIK